MTRNTLKALVYNYAERDPHFCGYVLTYAEENEPIPDPSSTGSTNASVRHPFPCCLLALTCVLSCLLFHFLKPST